MMACARRFRACQEVLARGEWGRPQGDALIDRSALIIGLGAVGKALAQRLKAMGMRISANDLMVNEKLVRELALERMGLPEQLMEMLPDADFVVSTATLNENTRGLLSMSVFERMKPGAFVINISRGPVVNEKDLLEALDRGMIAGAGLDVLNQEPPAPDHPLLLQERVVVTPHTAGVTEQSFSALGRAVAENVERLRRGEPILFTTNP